MAKLKRYRDVNYLRAINKYQVIEKSSLKVEDIVIYLGEKFTYVKTIKGGNIQIKSVLTGKIKNVNFLSVKIPS